MPGSLSPWPVTAAGSNGHPVWTLQDLLRARGHAVAVDGIFGPQTDAAVKAFQTSKGLTANGTVDPTTWKARSSSRSRRARAATRCAGCRRNFSSATGPAIPPKACKSMALSARKPTSRCADFNTPCRLTFPRSRWTASSARSPGRRWSAACCRASGAHGHLPTCLGARAAPGQDVVGATQKPGGTIIHRRRLPFRWGHVVGDFNGKKVFRSSAAVVRCCGVRGYVGSRLNRGNDRKIRTLIATGRRRGRHIASLLAVKDRARAP